MNRKTLSSLFRTTGIGIIAVSALSLTAFVAHAQSPSHTIEVRFIAPTPPPPGAVLEAKPATIYFETENTIVVKGFTNRKFFTHSGEADIVCNTGFAAITPMDGYATFTPDDKGEHRIKIKASGYKAVPGGSQTATGNAKASIQYDDGGTTKTLALQTGTDTVSFFVGGLPSDTGTLP